VPVFERLGVVRIVNNLFITNKVWAMIRDVFSEEQKEQLRKAKSGEMICPPGVMVDADELSKNLAYLLFDNIKSANRRLPSKDRR
jgi:hypothetical protein